MIVRGEGPTPCRVMLIGEAPGVEEDRTGRPFIGRSGQLLNRYFGSGGIPPRDECYITNVVKTRPPNNRDPTPAEITEGLPALCEEIAACQPEIIVTLGRTALRLFLDLDMEAAHGMYFEMRCGDTRTPLLQTALEKGKGEGSLAGSTRLFSCYHPAFALHDPTMQSLLTYDFERLGHALRGLLPPRTVDRDERGTYRLTDLTPSTLYSPRLAIDTEGYKGAVWGLSYSDIPGKGVVMRAADAPKFKRFLVLGRAAWEATPRPVPVRVILHHALHDLPILRELGIDLIEMGIPFTDTMVAAYLLGLEPQGLKPLAYRHCGIVMGDYLDLTAVSDDRVAREWLIQLCASLPEPQPPKSKRKKSDPPIVEYDPDTADLARARTLIERMLSKGEAKHGIRKRWNDCAARELLEDDLALVEEMPLPTLDDVIADHGSDQVVIDYAGADADATRRLAPLLEAQIDAYGLRDAYETTVGIIPMVDRMQTIGLGVNLDHFHALLPIFDGRAADLDDAIESMVGVRLNANSGDQVAPLLFDRLHLHQKAAARHIKIKRTASGRLSTDDKVLEALDGLHPVIDLLRKRRECTKLKGAYILPVLRMTDPDGRLRCTLMLTRTDTGRLAAKKPNLLAWPKHSEWGMLIRSGFVAAEGRELGAWDMDQIEMRVFADEANEINMLLAFAAGVDLHASTAALVFGRKVEDIYGEYKAKEGKGGAQRFAAKCFHPDTEVLTRIGWKQILSLAPGEEIMQAHPNRGRDVSLSWVVPTEVFSQPADAGLIHLTNESLDVRVTPDHRMLGWRANGEWGVCRADEFVEKGWDWACAGLASISSGQKLPLLPRLRLAVALQADGHITQYGGIRWGFSKARKIERMTALLDEAEIVYRVSTAHPPSAPKPITTFTLTPGAAGRLVGMLDDDKTLPWGWLNYPRAWREAVLDEAAYWDSHVTSSHSYIYSSTKQKNIDVLQALAAITGRKATASEAPSSNLLSVKQRAHANGGTAKEEKIPYIGILACLSVPSSFILVRDAGKTMIIGQSVNFGTLMGITEFGLLAQFHKNGQLHYQLDDCVKLLTEWRRAYPSGAEWIVSKHEEARRYGYVRDMFGRLRWLDGVHSDDEYIRAEAERMAQSTPIQSGAQGIMQRAMKNMWPDLRALRRRVWAEPLLQTHDDLLFEYDVRVRDEIERLVVGHMGAAVTLKVPITAKGAYGPTWASVS